MTVRLVVASEPSESGSRCRKHVLTPLPLSAGRGQAWGRELPSWAALPPLPREGGGWQEQGLGHWEVPGAQPRHGARQGHGGPGGDSPTDSSCLVSSRCKVP